MNSFELATEGFYSRNSLSLSTNGFLSSDIDPILFFCLRANLISKKPQILVKYNHLFFQADFTKTLTNNTLSNKPKILVENNKC